MLGANHHTYENRTKKTLGFPPKASSNFGQGSLTRVEPLDVAVGRARVHPKRYQLQGLLTLCVHQRMQQSLPTKPCKELTPPSWTPCTKLLLLTMAVKRLAAVDTSRGLRRVPIARGQAFAWTEYIDIL
jgi:hypothetical protein